MILNYKQIHPTVDLILHEVDMLHCIFVLLFRVSFPLRFLWIPFRIWTSQMNVKRSPDGIFPHFVCLLMYMYWQNMQTMMTLTESHWWIYWNTDKQFWRFCSSIDSIKWTWKHSRCLRQNPMISQQHSILNK